MQAILKGFTVIELMIVVCIIGILCAIVYGAYIKREEIVVQTKEQPQHEKEIVQTNETHSVKEQCIDGILYLFVTKDGKDYMAPKENRYGDNERCY